MDQKEILWKVERDSYKMMYESVQMSNKALLDEVDSLLAHISSLMARHANMLKRIGSPKLENCVICLEKEADHVLLNCGHLCACKGCAETILEMKNHCPLCREQINTIHRVFLS